MEPLAGLLVFDLTRLLPGPFCSWLLRSWGARVVKVEDLQAGDYLREVQPVWFEQLNAGAESVALDLKRAEGREVFLRLAVQADVVLEGFRPGVMERLGLGWDVLRGVNPRLVLTSISGYPSDSPLAARAGHDLNYLARSGLLSLMGEVPPIQLADLAGGLTAAAATLAAVVSARGSGRGTHVEASLAGAVAGLGSLLLAEARAGREPRREEMPLAGGMACYGIYRTADGGRVTLAALEPKFWHSFCQAAGRPDWAERHLDPDMRPELEALFAARTMAEWEQVAGSGDLCVEPVLRLTEAAHQGQNPQSVLFDGIRPSLQGQAPAHGQQTKRLLEFTGYSRQEIDALVAEGVVSVRDCGE